MVINARDVTGRRIRMDRQAAISDLGREVLGATTLASAVNSATEAITAVLRPRRCSIVLTIGASRSSTTGWLSPWPTRPAGRCRSGGDDGDAPVAPTGG